MDSGKHLTIGSTCPPLQPDKLRVYSMRFCPYAQRALLVAEAKNIPTDVVYVNLKDKPEWIFEKNPGGKVPTIEFNDGRVLYESLIVADYLDEAYSGPKLSSDDPYQKAVDRILVDNFAVIGVFNFKLIFVSDVPASEIQQLISKYNEVIKMMSKELENRGTAYFGGNDRPGMIDYMIWPWFERRPVIQLTHPGPVSYAKLGEDTKAIDEWVDRMLQDRAVQAVYLSPENHFKFCSSHKAGYPHYNLLLEE